MKNLQHIGLSLIAALAMTSSLARAAEQAPPKPMAIVVYDGSTGWKTGKPMNEQNIGAHIEYMGKLFKQGTLIANGPEANTDPLRGYYIFNTGDEAKIKTIIANDPGVKDHVLKSSEVMGWGVLINQFAANKEGEHFYILRYKPGQNWVKGKLLNEQNIGEHFSYITEETKQGVVVAGGPKSTGDEGIYIIHAADKNTVDSFIAKDPGVTAGIFAPVIIDWTVLQMQAAK